MKNPILYFLFHTTLTVILVFTSFSHNAIASVKGIEIKPEVETKTEIQKFQSQEDRHLHAVEIFNKAMEYSKTHEYDKAIIEFKKAIEIDPNFPEAHLNLGLTYAVKRENYDIALQETLEAIRLKPKDMPLALRNLWWIYRQLKRYDKAFETLNKIVVIEPDNPANFINLGDAYVTDKMDFELAVKTYKKGLELKSGHPFIHRKLGKAYEYQGKYDLAIEQYKKAIDINPSDAYSYLFLAVALGKSGKKDEIAPKMKEAHLEISESIKMIRFDTMLLQYYADELEAERLIENTKTAPIHKCQALYYIGMKYLWEGNKPKAKQLLEEAESLKVEALSEYEYAKTELKLLETKQKSEDEKENKDKE